MSYTHTVTVPLSWEDAVQRTREALGEQGFGILTEIDVRATFESKLGTEAADAVGDYVILGACNPTLASRALAAEPELGALLPCNVVVRRGKDARETTVEAIDPQTMVQLSDSPVVREVADDADARLRRALAGLGDSKDISN
ncbi:MAG TPA: ABC transporter [Arthrobacter bacterium]|nr:ABC transporter [Arthrobacter sp.]HAP90733.1 ABC transporter [Arthrobacter sp.]HCN22250.1 ABC transporter [Arthrobacter sp.]